MEITRSCNLQCVFCSNDSSAEMGSELSTEEFLNIVDDLSNFGVKDLKIYGGEPFLREDIFSFIAKGKLLGIKVSVYTNGTVINQGAIEKLKDLSVDKLVVSVDSFIAHIHDRIRGFGGTFDVVVKNIKELVKEKITVDVFLTVCKFNQNKIGEIYGFLHSLGVRDVKTNFVSKVGRAKKCWEEVSLTYEETIKCIEEVNDSYAHFFGQLIRKPCQAGVGEVFISAIGDVFPCPLMLDPEYRAGNIKENSFKEIWENPCGLMLDIREINSNRLNCHGCAKKEICGGGCRARAASMHNGDIKAPDVTSCILQKETLQ